MSKQPITIKRGSFEATLYDVNSLLELPMANLRKLWKTMFHAADENEETIDTIRAWLPEAVTNTDAAVHAAQEHFRQTARETETLRSNVAVFGSVATKEQKADLAKARRLLKAAEKRVKTAKAAHARAHKLQTIFTEMADQAGY